MRVIVIKHIVWYRRGFERIEFEPGPEAVEMDDDCAAVSLSEGWARAESAKAEPGAPENKDAAKKPRERKTAQT